MSSRTGKKRNLVMGLALVAVCAVIGAVSLGGSTKDSVAFAELPKRAGEPCTVYGVLDARSIKPIKGANLVEFTLLEEETNRPLKVVYDNPRIALPANFPNASHAKANGTYDPVDGRFECNEVLTKCPSKYDKGDVEIEREQLTKQWQAQTGQTVTK
ncbi:MAG: cytochrome c maturation protein CcmE [Armatimonadota bacterium]